MAWATASPTIATSTDADRQRAAASSVRIRRGTDRRRADALRPVGRSRGLAHRPRGMASPSSPDRRAGGPAVGTASRCRWPGFGCLFGLAFLVIAGSLLAMAGFVLSHAGPFPGLIVLVLSSCCWSRSAGRSGRPAGPSISWSTRPAGSRPATTRSASGRRARGIARRASWSPASTRWPPASRPTSASAATSSPRSATSCARR